MQISPQSSRVTRANSFNGRLAFLVLSILINSFFNALTVSTHLGSAIWTASAVSLSSWLHCSLGNILFLEGVIVAFVNLLLLGRFDYFRLIRNLLFITPFSYLLAFFNYRGPKPRAWLANPF